MLSLVLAAAAFSASASNDWLSLRKRTILSVWPDGGGALPSDAVPASVTPNYRDFADVTQLVWNISCSKFSLNSTVYHSARTVGERTDDIIIHHHGHAKACDKTLPESRCDSNRSWYDFYNVTDYYHRELGADVAFHYMPLFGPNEQQGFPVSHTFFEPYQQAGVATLRFFLEPVIRTINWAKAKGYKRVIMIGKSGGGWTTTLIAALDARVALSFPIAGSISLNFFHISWDFEQQPREANETWYMNEVSYTMLYALATIDDHGARTRSSVQVLHENDPCCFFGAHRHAGILSYNEAVMAELPTAGEGVFSTAISDWNQHAVCQMDRVIIATAKQQIDAKAQAFDALPCDILRAAALPCPYAPPRANASSA